MRYRITSYNVCYTKLLRFFLSAYAEKLNARPDRLTTDSFAYEKDDALTDERLAFQFENAVLAESAAGQGNRNNFV